MTDRFDVRFIAPNKPMSPRELRTRVEAAHGYSFALAGTKGPYMWFDAGYNEFGIHACAQQTFTQVIRGFEVPALDRLLTDPQSNALTRDRIERLRRTEGIAMPFLEVAYHPQVEDLFEQVFEGIENEKPAYTFK